MNRPLALLAAFTSGAALVIALLAVIQGRPELVLINLSSATACGFMARLNWAES